MLFYLHFNRLITWAAALCVIYWAARLVCSQLEKRSADTGGKAKKIPTPKSCLMIAACFSPAVVYCVHTTEPFVTELFTAVLYPVAFFIISWLIPFFAELIMTLVLRIERDDGKTLSERFLENDAWVILSSAALAVFTEVHSA